MDVFSGHDWTESDILDLSVKDSPRRYKIHKELLAKVAPAIGSKGFREDRENHYMFEDTHENTVKYLIQWAYSGEYQVLEDDPNLTNWFLEHARVYILANIYLIDKLKELAFTYLTELIESRQKDHAIFRPDYEGSNLAELMGDDHPADELIQLFVYCFSDQLPEDDYLLDWLAKFIAWRIDDFLGVPKFQKIMPSISPFIIPAMRSGERAPWVPASKDKSKKAYALERLNLREMRECSSCGGENSQFAAYCSFCKATLLSGDDTPLF